jgi:hypothetical protein
MMFNLIFFQKEYNESLYHIFEENKYIIVLTKTRTFMEIRFLYAKYPNHTIRKSKIYIFIKIPFNERARAMIESLGSKF